MAATTEDRLYKFHVQVCVCLRVRVCVAVAAVHCCTCGALDQQSRARPPTCLVSLMRALVRVYVRVWHARRSTSAAGASSCRSPRSSTAATSTRPSASSMSRVRDSWPVAHFVSLTSCFTATAARLRLHSPCAPLGGSHQVDVQHIWSPGPPQAPPHVLLACRTRTALHMRVAAAGTHALAR
jgi:hypothetical protein